MAARGLISCVRSMKNSFNACVRHHDNLKLLWIKGNGSRVYPKVAGFTLGAAVLLENTSQCQKLEKVDPAKLTSSYLLRNAAAANVDTAITLHTQTVATYIDIHQKYIQSVEGLLKLQDVLVTSLDSEPQERRVWDALLDVRKQVNDYRATLTELEFLYSSSERLINNAAEAAYLAGAEYASSMASERHHAAKLKIDKLQEETRKMETAIAQKEAWVIGETSKHADKERNDEKREENDEVTAEPNPPVPSTQSFNKDENIAESREPFFGGSGSDYSLSSDRENGEFSENKNWFDILFDKEESKTSGAG